MSQLVLDLPETLRQQLETHAQIEGVAVNDFVVDALTKRIASAYTVRVVPEEEVAQQRVAFATLLQSLKRGSPEEVAKVLAEREVVEPEPGLSPELIARVQKLIIKRQGY
jgi:hypothetical protein